MTVLKVARLVIERSLEAQTLAPDDAMRAQHDVFVQLAAIMSGDVALMRKSADGCVSANPLSKAKQFYEAWSGILRAHLLDEHENEMKQLSLLVKDEGLGLFAEPSPALAKAFCRREYGDLNREIRKAIENNRREAEDLGALVGTQLFLSRDHTIFRLDWRWPEAAFAKLAIEAGAALELDDFWIPNGFIVDWRSPAGKK